ncbi:MAG TPA: sugar phosphate isomerase/epimerase family protein [Vicinamibacterales bacterium]|jgi:sugar phosphate isomerase/epimerase
MNRFGISTHLFHEQRLSREHLVHIAAHGFETIELFATRTHFDYHDEKAVADLAEWLSDTRLQLHSVHAPIVDSLKDGKWVGSFSNASGEESRRKAALAETEAALALARQLPFQYLVLHLGMPTVERVPPGDNQPAAARRSLEAIAEMAALVNVRVAVEVIPNALSSATALVRLIEEDLDGPDIGVCFDYGHAHLMGDLSEAIETLSGHVWTTHVHDNGGRRDEHLLPYSGTIDWDAAMMETQKVGYDGTLMLEVADLGDPIDVLKRSIKVRERLDKTFVTF